jgi:hypothetical protein
MQVKWWFYKQMGLYNLWYLITSVITIHLRWINGLIKLSGTPRAQGFLATGTRIFWDRYAPTRNRYKTHPAWQFKRSISALESGNLGVKWPETRDLLMFSLFVRSWHNPFLAMMLYLSSNPFFDRRRSPAVSLSIPTSIQWKIGESCDRDQWGDACHLRCVLSSNKWLYRSNPLTLQMPNKNYALLAATWLGETSFVQLGSFHEKGHSSGTCWYTAFGMNKSTASHVRPPILFLSPESIDVV